MRFPCHTRILPVFIAVAWLADPWPARADFITNGNFSLGLAGWSTNDPGFVSASGGKATITEDQVNLLISEVDLWQDFIIPSGAQKLDFKIVGLTTDAVESGVPPPFFAADLVNPIPPNDSLVTPIAGSTDYYTRDLTSPTFKEQFSSTGVSVTPTNDASPSMGSPVIVSLNLPAALANTPARILFRVSPSLDTNQTNASISITDVSGTVSGGTGPVGVPEPTSLVLCGLGVVVLAGRGWRARLRARAHP
jgi:hypothetical protein